MSNKIQLNAPAGCPSSLIAAADAGADAIYIGFRSPTNLRNLPGLNFSMEEAAEGIEYAHRCGTKVCITVNSHPLDEHLDECLRAVDDAVDVGADAVIVADWAVLDYAKNRHPDLSVHLSCVAGVTDAVSIRFYREEFGVDCIILPRVLSLEHIAALRRETDVLLEVMVFGVLCANYDGRCYLSSFITGTSANSMGACAPAAFVEFEETEGDCTTVRLNGIEINSFTAEEQRTYPTPCKGKYYNSATGRRSHAFQDPCCLNALPVLPELAETGIDILKIEGRQRSPAYVGLATGLWRKAIDALDLHGVPDPAMFQTSEAESILEGETAVLGALIGD